jgi:hypothetical protein
MPHALLQEVAMPAARKKLPIGIQTFADIIEGGYYYVDKFVDKTPHIHRAG